MFHIKSTFQFIHKWLNSHPWRACLAGRLVPPSTRGEVRGGFIGGNEIVFIAVLMLALLAGGSWSPHLHSRKDDHISRSARNDSSAYVQP